MNQQERFSTLSENCRKTSIESALAKLQQYVTANKHPNKIFLETEIELKALKKQVEELVEHYRRIYEKAHLFTKTHDWNVYCDFKEVLNGERSNDF